MAVGPNSKQAPMSTTASSSRAQILATEHWSLLASRSMTWSEVMSRITIHLSITSAFLVALALMAQVSGFGTPFRVLSIGLTTATLILGTLTGVRVLNASIDDIAMMQGMNRIRAAYIELDPEIKKYLVTAYYDDSAGIMQSSLMGTKRTLPSHILGSTNMYIEIVNALTAGTLGALVTNTAGGGPLVTAFIGLLAGVLCLLCWLKVNRRSFLARNITANFPTPEN